MDKFSLVKEYLLNLDYEIVQEDVAEELVVVNQESEGLLNVIVDCEDTILLIEAFLIEVNESNSTQEFFKELLIKNRELVHGAFVLDDTGTKLLFRDTLQLENLDQNELEGSLNALKLMLSENIDFLLDNTKKELV